MKSFNLRDILPDLNTVDSYIMYRRIGDWCSDNAQGTWKFEYTSHICAYGIDIPGRIFFWSDEDATAFVLSIPWQGGLSVSS